MDETVSIRRVTADDYKDLHRLNREAFGYDFPLEETGERLRAILGAGKDRLLAAELDGRVVGYVHGADYECTYAPPMKNILAIAVEPGLQGRGVGRRLLAALEDWARADGSAGVRLVSGENRRGAHQFYPACGYIHRKTQKNFVKFFQ